MLIAGIDDDPLDVIVGVLGVRPENRNVDAFAPLPSNLEVVIHFQIIPVKAIAFDKLAENLLCDKWCHVCS